MQSATTKTLFRSIRKTLGRYIAVAAIIALGVGLFAGLKVSRTAMVDTYAAYLKETGLYDYRLISTLGFEETDADVFAALDGIAASEGNVAVDALVRTEQGETAYRIFALPEAINTATLTEGRMPEAAGEALADAARFDGEDIGKTLMLVDGEDRFAVQTLTIVGLATSPLYISTERGSTQLGSGTLSGFLYVHPDTMASDVYTDIYLTIEEPAALYSEAYDRQIDALEGAVDALLGERVQMRHDALLAAIPAGFGLEAGIPSPASYLLTRSENPGYASFESDTQIVYGISNIFPVFFFLVAILICITTMTRMVEEERTQIGAMKAMGYGSFAIMRKYLLYSASASLLGWAVGFFLGTWGIPKVLWMAYGSIYRFADLLYVFSPGLALGTLAASLLCAVSAVLMAAHKELAAMPAETMRPKAPKEGKRIFLERFPAVWNRLSFLSKVSIRNVFRYKKRLLMMVLGVSGCTALLLAGFGIRDSVQNVANYQYGEIIQYDLDVTFGGTPDEDAFVQASGYDAQDILFVHTTAATIVSERSSQDVTLAVFEGDALGRFIDMHKGDEPLALPVGSTVALGANTASMLGVQSGASVRIRLSDGVSLEVASGGIFDNYVDHVVYLPAEAMPSTPETCSAYIRLPEGADPHEAAASLLALTGVSHVAINAEMRDRINNSLSSINYIVLLVVFCAGALGFVVIYNLTNINILERTREIATIGVLGFREGEMSAYVLRENLILSGAGALFGLVLGKLLHTLIMTMITVSGIAFDIRVSPGSYVISFALTMIFGMIVNAVMRRKLQKIPMAESLKSVE